VNFQALKQMQQKIGQDAALATIERLRTRGFDGLTNRELDIICHAVAVGIVRILDEPAEVIEMFRRNQQINTERHKGFAE
jgi:hypothetical protein